MLPRWFIKWIRFLLHTYIYTLLFNELYIRLKKKNLTHNHKYIQRLHSPYHNIKYSTTMYIFIPGIETGLSSTVLSRLNAVALLIGATSNNRTISSVRRLRKA